MSDYAIEVDRVWKKFHRGQIYDSLRDLIPALAKRIVGRGPQNGELSKQDFWALKDVNFQVRRGEAVGIIGPNGAGKSTMLKILSRILRPNRGRVAVHGRMSAMIEVAAGFHADLTGRENIYLNGSILGMRKKDIDRKLDDIVDFSGVEDFIDTPVKRFSSGMQARLGFAVAAHMDPEVLLVDEVLSVGDVAYRAKCIKRMADLIRNEVSVIFVSHNLDQIRRLCSRCVVLDHGTVRFIGDVEQACREYYAAFRSQNHVDAPADGHREIGQLLGLSILDEEGRPTFHVQSGRRMMLDISYALAKDLKAVAVEVNVVSPGHGLLANCDAFNDHAELPATRGAHTVRLAIDRLPLLGGEYVLSLHLRDLSNSQHIDSHLRRYPLLVDGFSHSRGLIQLATSWTVQP